MEDRDLLARQFEEHRTHLRGVAYRMLGSLSDADDAVQEAWLRLDRSDANQVTNLGGWLTTVVARVCLDMLRSRAARREEPLDDRLPDPVVWSWEAIDPEQDALVADSVGLALLVVLATLSPAERLAFVLHDIFAVPFDEVAGVLGRTTPATRKLASRARHRARAGAASPDVGLAAQRRVVDAFLAAARVGDLDALVEVLDPEVVARADAGDARGTQVVSGAHAVARQALAFSRAAGDAQLVVVNGAAGILARRAGHLHAVMGFTVRRRRIVDIQILVDSMRLRRLEALWRSPR